MIPGGVNPMLLSGGAGGYQLQRSLRFRASASAYLSRTAAAPTNATRWTWSAWVKRGALANSGLIDGFVGGTNFTTLAFSNSALLFYNYVSGAEQANLSTSALFRDPSAWYHIVCVYDSANATAADRLIIHVNGVRQTLTTTTGVALNAVSYINSNGNSQRLGIRSDAAWYLDGYLSDVHFIDGQALTPSAFGQFDSNGMWQPRLYTGTYGTNGFRLDFSDPTSTTTLMADRSGNGNNWTANNISLTAGATYDSMIDVPLGGGGNERGNYATLNPLVLADDCTYSDGNLKFAYGSGAFPYATFGTFPMSSGEWYWTTTITANSSGSTSALIIGLANTLARIEYYPGSNSNGWGYYGDTGAIKHNAADIAIGASFTVGDTLGFKFNADTGTLSFYKQTASSGAFVLQATVSSLPPGTYWPCFGDGGGTRTGAAAVNFGQQPVNNTAWIGSAKPLHTGNLTNTTPITSGAFTGNVSSDGPPVWCNGTPETLTINGNAVTWGTHADKLANGFKLRTSSASYNSSGSNTWTATYLSPSSKSAFKYQLAKANP